MHNFGWELKGKVSHSKLGVYARIMPKWTVNKQGMDQFKWHKVGFSATCQTFRVALLAGCNTLCWTVRIEHNHDSHPEDT